MPSHCDPLRERTSDTSTQSLINVRAAFEQGCLIQQICATVIPGLSIDHQSEELGSKEGMQRYL